MKPITPDALFLFLKKNELFSNLSDAEIAAILPLTEQQTFQPGQYLLREGEKEETLYLIIKGQVEIIKAESQREESHILGLLGPNEWVGEMASLEHLPRSASIRAAKKTTVVALSLDQIKSLPEHRPLHFKILFQLIKRISQRFRKANLDLIQHLKEKLKIIRSHTHVTQTIIDLIIFIALFFNIEKIVNSYWPRLPHTYSPAIIFPIAICTVWVIAISGYPLKYYGLIWKKGWRMVGQSLALSTPVLAFALISEWLLIRFVPALQGQSLFSPFSLTDYKGWALDLAIYLPLVPVQELIVRGFLQTTFTHFFLSKHRVIWAILTSNLIFELFHTVKGLWFAFFAFVLGVFWGYLFNAQKTLVGVCVSHAIIAIWCFYVLNYLKILELIP